MRETQLTLGELALWGPAARGVLLQYRLDFCCRGHHTLSQACLKAGLNAELVAARLRAAAARSSDPTDWSNSSVEALVTHLVDDYHRPLPEQLEAVIAAAEKVERVHASKKGVPRGLAAHLTQVRDELTQHMAEEEEEIFSALLQGERGKSLRDGLSAMLRDHDDHGDNLAKTRALTSDLKAPAHACATWRSLYEQLEQLESDLMEHIHLENHVLFPLVLTSER